jgi:hypothetical protein
MSDDDIDAQAYGRPPEPNPDLSGLDRLVGTWELSGDVRGTVTYEWMEGDFSLLQRVELEQQDGQRIMGIEIIGHERPFGAEPGEEIRSRFYSNMGDILDYVYGLEGVHLKIWAGERDSPAYFENTFGADDDTTVTGAWHYPGGGGYEAVSTRVE